MISICMYAIKSYGKRLPREVTLNSKLRGGGRLGLVAACLALRSHVQRVSVGSNACPPRYWVVERVAVLWPGHVKAIDQRACGIRYEKLQRKTMAPKQAAFRIRLFRAMRSSSRRNIRRVVDPTKHGRNRSICGPCQKQDVGPPVSSWCRSLELFACESHLVRREGNA